VPEAELRQGAGEIKGARAKDCGKIAFCAPPKQKARPGGAAPFLSVLSQIKR